MTSGTGLIWADGTVIDATAATVPILSHAVQRGSTVFDVLAVHPVGDEAHVFGLRPHVTRFLASMELMGMERPYGVGELETAIATTVVANPGDPIVKIVATWSEPGLGTLPASLRPSVWVATVPPDDAPQPDALRLATARAAKIPSEQLPPGLKVAASYTAGVREQLAARANGFDSVLYRTAAGYLAEGVTQSAFVVKGGRILLPPLDAVLDGITRRAVLEVAHDMGITAEIRPVSWDEVVTADELFLCSTTGPVRPVSALDERTFETPGPVTRQLANAMERLLSGAHRLSDRWLTPVEGLVGQSTISSNGS